MLNRLSWTKYGAALSDLPDMPYRDWFDSGKTVFQAAAAMKRWMKEEYL